MKEKLTNNLGLKLLAFVVAVALWLVVVNIDDPVITNTYSGINVEILNAESLTNQGKVYEVLDGTDVINVTVTGKRSLLDSISKENIKAVADLKNLTLMDTVEISLSTNKNSNMIEGIKSDTAAVHFSVENLMTKHFSVTVEVNGDPEDGCIIGKVNSDLNTVSVSGPSSVISKIASVKSLVSVAGRNSDMTTTSTLRCYDESGKVIEHRGLSISATSVNVSVEVLATKAVEVHYGFEGKPAKGYMVSAFATSDRNAIYLAGKPEVLAEIYSVEVPGTAVSVEGATEEVTKKINLYDYLPEGVIFADPNFMGNVTVRVPVEKTEERTVEIPANRIKLADIPEGMTASLALEEEEDVKILVESLAAVFDITDFSSAEIQLSLQSLEPQGEDEQVEPGRYEVEAVVILPDGIFLVKPCRLDVILEKEEE